MTKSFAVLMVLSLLLGLETSASPLFVQAVVTVQPGPPSPEAGHCRRDATYWNAALCRFAASPSLRKGMAYCRASTA